MRRGEIRWYTVGVPNKRRPVLLLTRDQVIDALNEIIVAPATRTIRGLETEVLLSPDDGMPAACALNFDHVSVAHRSRLGPVLADLAPARWPEVERALLVACGFLPTLRRSREMTRLVEARPTGGTRCSARRAASQGKSGSYIARTVVAKVVGEPR